MKITVLIDNIEANSCESEWGLSFLIEYKVNYKYAGRKLLLRYSPDLSKIYIVNDDESLEEIHLLDKHANSNVKREKIMITKGE